MSNEVNVSESAETKPSVVVMKEKKNKSITLKVSTAVVLSRISYIKEQIDRNILYHQFGVDFQLPALKENVNEYNHSIEVVSTYIPDSNILKEYLAYLEKLVRDNTGKDKIEIVCNEVPDFIIPETPKFVPTSNPNK